MKTVGGKGGGGQGAGTVRGGNTLWTERKTAGTRRGERTRQSERGGGGNDPYGTPNGTDSSQEGARGKNDFRVGSKKTEILLGC